MRMGVKMIIGLHYKKKKLVEILNIKMWHRIDLLFINKDVAFFESNLHLPFSYEEGSRITLSCFRNALDYQNCLKKCDSGSRAIEEFIYKGDRDDLINLDTFPKVMFDWKNLEESSRM